MTRMSALVLQLLRRSSISLMMVTASGMWITHGCSKSTTDDTSDLNRANIAPYLQITTPTSVTVSWETFTSEVGTLAYREPAGTWTYLTEGSSTNIHRLAIAGLSAETNYEYGPTEPFPAVPASVSTFQTPPDAASASDVLMWVFGDAGTGDQHQLNVRDAMRSHSGATVPNAMLTLGDNAYPDATYQQYIAGLFNPYRRELAITGFWPTYGNHDSHNSNAATETGPYFRLFTLPKAAEAGGVASGTSAYFSFDVGKIHCVNLSSIDIERSTSSPMYTWLSADLAANDKEWIIAYWHHPPYSRGSHNSDNEIEMTEMRSVFLPLLESAGVDLVLCGHSHAYERSLLIDGHYGFMADWDPSMIVDAGDGDPVGDGAYAKPSGVGVANAGTVYVVAGSSGKLSGGSFDHPAMPISHYSRGALALTLIGPVMTVVFIDDSGATLDTFSISKAPGPVTQRDRAPTYLTP